MQPLLSVLSWFPAVIFPASQALQYWKIRNIPQLEKNPEFRKDYEHHLEAFHPQAFLLILLINIASFIFAGKYDSPKTWLAFLLPGVFILGTLSNYYRRVGRSQAIIWGCILAYLVGGYYIVYYGDTLHQYADLVGAIVAVVLPIAVASQLRHLQQRRTASGVSLGMWILQCIGNVGCYVLVGKYRNPINIMAYLVTAVLCAMIVVLALRKQHAAKNEAVDTRHM